MTRIVAFIVVLLLPTDTVTSTRGSGTSASGCSASASAFLRAPLPKPRQIPSLVSRGFQSQHYSETPPVRLHPPAFLPRRDSELSSSVTAQQQDEHTENDVQVPLKDVYTDKKGASQSRGSLLNAICILVWALSMSAFIIMNAKGTRTRPHLLLHALTRSQWSFVHAVSTMLFSSTTILMVLVEYLIVTSKNASVMRFWFLSIPRRLDAALSSPALTVSIISGVAQAAIDYGGLAESPGHVLGACHLLLIFGLWWAITDVTSQRLATDAVLSMPAEECDVVKVPKVLWLRILSGAVSCGFVVAMYALMVLKPRSNPFC